MKTLKLFFVVLFISFPLFAQGGSIYSGYGIGDIQNSFSSRRFAMGELGIALADKDYLSPLNPAGWNEMRLTRFELSILYSGNNTQDKSSSVYHTDVHFNGFMLGFPVKEDLGISAAIGVVPYSNVNYDVYVKKTDPLVSGYSAEHTGSGGISKFIVGTSFKLPLNISLGISYDYYFGKTETSTIITYIDSSSYPQSSFDNVTNNHGIGITAGLISGDISSIFGSSKIKDFKFGFVFSPSITMSTDTTDYSTTQIGTITNYSSSFKTKVPYKFGLGTTFRYDDDYTFTIDYIAQPFSQYEWKGKTYPNLQDYYKFGVGFEYRNSNYRSVSYWDHVMFRAGVSYEQTPYKINNTSINQLSFYCGFSLPIAYDNTIDFAFQYGKRGTTDNNLILENLFKFTVTASIGDLWFIQTDR
jgi:hypothetical protein